eukprot:TRINITY_DN15765_c0_g1_i1.p2 TRINITY_DN15765_c0_g1~~TRINITY_DN15765_c0_g1_i1.p2  ORF type:complete len:133 (+),score=29.25 TRINITY_DN15765_c0_g1_i1:191-589(+)
MASPTVDGNVNLLTDPLTELSAVSLCRSVKPLQKIIARQFYSQQLAPVQYIWVETHRNVVEDGDEDLGESVHLDEFLGPHDFFLLANLNSGFGRHIRQEDIGTIIYFRDDFLHGSSGINAEYGRCIQEKRLV